MEFKSSRILREKTCLLLETICWYLELRASRTSNHPCRRYAVVNLHARGWACVKEALTFPTSSTFQKITGLTNRPLALEDSKLPQDQRLQLVSGIDLTGSVNDVVASMKQKIAGVDSVTHVIFTAYIEKGGFDELRKVNTDLVKTAITAVDELAPGLQSVALQTGGKAYGVEFSDKLEIKPPLKETQPRIPEPCKYPQSIREHMLSLLNCEQIMTASSTTTSMMC